MTQSRRLRMLAFAVCTALAMAFVPMAFADVYVNVMAVNGSAAAKETPVTYNLPPELKASDILDTNGLDLDYNVNDATYYVHGKVTLAPKESKTFRIRLKDIWKVTPEQVADIKKQIDDGYDQLGKGYDQANADVLKGQLNGKLDYIIEQQTAKADSVERRIDSYRTYVREVHRIQTEALAVDYWRSKPGEKPQEKIIRYKIELENPLDKPKSSKSKSYLPSEVKPENVVEYEGFDIRFDQLKQQAFLYREEELQPKEKKSYSVGIRDIWYVHQIDIDYLRKRADYAYGFLKNSKYDATAKHLYDRVSAGLGAIETSQALQLELKEHISAYRTNQRTLEDSRADVEELERLLSIYREDLEKSKVENVLQKMRSLKGIADVAKQVFEKKPTPSKTWDVLGWVLGFVALLTLINFIVGMIRGGNKKVESASAPPSTPKEETNAKK